MHRAVRELTAPPSPGAVLELRDVTLLQPLAVPGPGGVDVGVTVTAAGGGWDVRVSGADADLAVAAAAWVEPGPAPRHDLAAARARCVPVPAEVADPDREELLVTGAHWPVAADVRAGPDEQVAELVLAGGPAEGYWLHPALLDRAIGFPRLDGGGWLPMGYGAVLARAPLPDRVCGHVRWTDRDEDLISADVTVTDPDGVELVAVTDFLLRRVPTTPAEPTASAWAAWATAAGTGTGRAAGIRTDAGLAALDRALGPGLGPQLVVTPESVDELLGLRVPAAAEPVAPATADPEPRLLDGAYVPPRTELEATLAAIWTRVLGIGDIGVTDDFFELGGDSLLGVQLVAAIRKETGARVPMRTLFDLPTVAQIAVRVEELRAAPAAPAPAESPIPRLRRPR
jgi:acyl carrier protein